MAIAYDNSAFATPGSTSYNAAFTVSGTNPYLLVSVFIAAGTVSSITYGGQAMTLINSDTSFGASFVYGLLNPPTGSNTLSINAGLTIIEVEISSFSGVTGGVGAITKTTANASSISTSLTTTSAKSWVSGFINTNSSPQTFTATGSAFKRLNGNSNGIFDTNGSIATPSSVTMGASYTFSNNSVLFLTELKEATPNGFLPYFM